MKSFFTDTIPSWFSPDKSTIVMNAPKESEYKQQDQAQLQVNNQAQKTAQTQRFIETVDNAYISVSSAALMYKQNKRNNGMVDLLCDNAVLALNMFAVCCESLVAEKNQDAIDLGTKHAMEKFSKLALENADAYKLVEPHRKFMFAALGGEKNLRYKEDRVDPGSVELFENNIDNINAAFAKVIANQQKFRKRQEAFVDPVMNKKLAEQHKAQLKEYHQNKKKNNNNNKQNNEKFVLPKQSDLYFTEKAKNSQFRDNLAAERKEKEKRDLDIELNGTVISAYDELLSRGHYRNAVLMLSKQRSVTYDSKIVIDYPIPCQMLKASEKDPENQILIEMCQPYDECTINAPVKMLEVNVEKVLGYEDKYIMKNGSLGYDSIKKQQEYPDLDQDQDMKST